MTMSEMYVYCMFLSVKLLLFNVNAVFVYHRHTAGFLLWCAIFYVKYDTCIIWLLC